MVPRKVAVTVTSAHGGLQGRKVGVIVMSVRAGPESKAVPVASGVNFTVARVARQGANLVGRRVRVDMRVGDHRVKVGTPVGRRVRADTLVVDHRATVGSRVDRHVRVGMPVGRRVRADSQADGHRAKVGTPVDHRVGADTRVDDRRVKVGTAVGRRVKADTRVGDHHVKVGMPADGHRATAGSLVLVAARVHAISRVLEVVRVRGAAVQKGVADSSVTRGLRASGNT